MQGKIVCADMTKRKKGETLEDMAEAFSYIDYLFPNDEEAMLLTETESVEEATECIKSTGVGNVIIKMWKAGMLHSDRCGKVLDSCGRECKLY